MTNAAEKEIVVQSGQNFASMMLMALDEFGIAEWECAFRHHYANAKALGLLPDDGKVVRKTLEDYGFTMQSTHLEHIPVSRAVMYLGNCEAPATVIAAAESYRNLGDFLFGMRIGGGKNLRKTVEALERVRPYESMGVWVRWDDGIDRSLYPRRKYTGRPAVGITREIPETECFRYFQPNPCGIAVGDCVVRGLAGALEIRWEDALDLLGAEAATAVNEPRVFREVLKRLGFSRHRPEKELTGADFCRMLNRDYHNGERVFAFLGKKHVAAFAPVGEPKQYKLLDSWDSSRLPIGEYWVKG